MRQNVLVIGFTALEHRGECWMQRKRTTEGESQTERARQRATDDADDES